VQTLKTAVIVVLLLVVLYGVYEVLNRPLATPPQEIARVESQLEELDIGLGGPAESSSVDALPTTPTNPTTTSAFPGGTMPDFEAPPVYGEGSPSPSTEPAMPDPPDFVASGSAARTPEASLPELPPTTGSNPPVTGDAAPPTTTEAEPSKDELTVAPSNPGPNLMQQNPYVDDPLAVGPPVQEEKSLGAVAYERAMRMAKTAIEEQKYRSALEHLSVFYESQDLTAAQHQELLDLLDPLAGRVIYSREHLVDDPYVVRGNETLMDIAARLDVPWQLLQKINGIERPKILLPGTELKVVRGPFRAEVDLANQELTVFLGDLYAGRFPVSVGSDPAPLEGKFKVREKKEDRAYFARGGTIPADSPRNPFGKFWIDLGSEMSIHGSPPGGSDGQMGCISLSPRDAEDVYSILSVGSTVRVLR
jgi:lipoprotein-anchoring transpeptidase ErfK/SrfK